MPSRRVTHLSLPSVEPRRPDTDHSLGGRPLTRRSLLRGGASLAMLGGAGALLAACGSSSKTASPSTTAPPSPTTAGSSSAASSAAASSATTAAGGAGASATTVPLLGTVAFQLGWIANSGYSGSYIASTRGYYRRHGVDVTIVPGGPSVSGMPLLIADKVFVAISDPPTVSGAIAEGGDVKIIGAGYQTNPACIMSLASKPITTPADLKGKVIGVGASDDSEWHAFLAINNIKQSELTTVPAGFDTTPLAVGQWDGYLAFLNDEIPQFQAKGIKTAVLKFQDYGMPSVNEVYTVTGATLRDPVARKKIVGFMAGEIEGWTVQLTDPNLGAQLTVDDFGKNNGFTLDGELLAAEATNAITVSADTQAHGLFYMSPAAIAQTVKTLSYTGVKASAAMFDTSILAEAYPLVVK